MYNNTSHRRFNVAGTTSFTFSPAAAVVGMTPAINAWTGAGVRTVEPEPPPPPDGARRGCKVTGPSPRRCGIR